MFNVDRLIPQAAICCCEATCSLACTCYHPLFLFNQYGDLERPMLRRGNHNSAKFWRRVLLPVIERYRNRDILKYYRGDAAPKAAGLPLRPANRS